MEPTFRLADRSDVEVLLALRRAFCLHEDMAFDEGTARVALLCHHDTVFPTGTVATWPFSRGADRCRGPGVADMKGGIAVAAHAARLLATGPRPFGRLELVSASDEETRPAAPLTLDRLTGYEAVLCMECGRVDGSIVSARKGGAAGCSGSVSVQARHVEARISTIIARFFGTSSQS